MVGERSEFITRWCLPNLTLNQCDSLKIISNRTAQLLNSEDKVMLYKYIIKDNGVTRWHTLQTVEYVDSKSGIKERFDK